MQQIKRKGTDVETYNSICPGYIGKITTTFYEENLFFKNKAGEKKEINKDNFNRV